MSAPAGHAAPAANASLMAYVGPKHEAFVNDQRLITAAMGPYGSAKTTGCIRKVINSAMWQEPQRDGVRRVRWCVVRDTYAQLETNVMNSWFAWFPKTKANWNGRELCHRIRYDVIIGDNPVPQPIEIEMYFRAMGDLKAEDVLKGMELTGLWLNEADTLSMDVFLFGFGRTGRYPAQKDGGCAWRGVIMDFNAPDIDNWVYDLVVLGQLGLTQEQEDELRAVLGPRFGIGFYVQPGGRSKEPPPENLQNLPAGYYEGLVLAFANKPNHLRRFVDNRFGAVSNGQPVFPEFNAEIHESKEQLRPAQGYPIHAGLDGGRTPAMVFFQMVEGQMRVLDELVIYDPGKTEQLQKLGSKVFAETAREFVAERYPTGRLGTVFYDPAIDNGTDDDDDDEDWLRFFRAEFKGVKFRPGGDIANRLEPRLESVRNRLVKLPGGRPAILLSPTCRVAIRALTAGYVYLRVKMSNGLGRFQDKPSKNDFSHVMDALQYASLGADTRADILDDIDARARSRPQGNVHHGGYAAAGGGYH
jgi:hypothetical protein